jgi:omega-6 fatty acid desaturase (delta-12 desaturase)
LMSYSAWAIGHNGRHHPFTNLVTHDHVWAPFSKADFDRLPWWRRSLERVYRTPLGHGLYYCVEDWWKHYFFRRTRVAGYGICQDGWYRKVI